MEDIAEITEYSADEEHLLKNRVTKKDEIEVGLEIVALEMGHILEELKDNLERLSWVKSAELENKENNKTTNEKDELAKKKALNWKSQEPQSIPITTISDKYQQKPTVKNYRRFPLTVNSKQQPVKANKDTKPVEKKMHNEGPQLGAQKLINTKPNYRVQDTSHRVHDTSHHVHCDKFPNCQFNMCPSHISNNRKITPYYGKMNTSMQQCRSSGSSTASSSKQQFIRKPSLQNSKALVKKQFSLCNKPSVVNENLKKLKEHVDNAIREKKTFTVCGNYYTIRRALVSRGWIEKIRILYNTFDRDNLRKLQSSSIPELLQGINDPKTGYVYKRVIMSKLLGPHQVDFYWDQNFDCFRVNRDNIKLTAVNRFRRGIFSYTSKQGLCESMKKAYWFQFPGVANVRHPRSYNLANSEDPKHFINDFKLTAAMSLLKWIVKNQGNYRHNKIITTTGKVPLKIYHFAIAELSKAVRRCKHEDIDYEIEEALDYQWNDFLENFYKIVHIGERFRHDDKENIASITTGAKNMLTKVGAFWPHLNMDGMMNIWILKPTNGSRGEGIYLCRTLQYILKIIKSNTTRRYVVQKYIERPLLIYNTKFDIRQWFVITSAVPLTIWIYKECYIRFSSQLFTLHKLQESIHLTNNSVQSRYRNCSRNEALPECNMWDSKQFKKYLANIGHPRVFTEIIYPGMRECLTGAILMNQGNIDTRKNCFELYGSDFMLTEDFKPWLIEINSRPALYPSTPITARMCPQVLDDLIKVIIDHPRNSKASTGRFELLYKEEIQKLPKLDPDALQLKGEKLPTSYFYTPEVPENGKTQPSTSPNKSKEGAHHNIHEISSEMKKTLENLLSLIQAERERRTQLRSQSSQVSQVNIGANKKFRSETDTKYYKRNFPQITNTDMSNCDDVTLKVIKSVATNLRIVESSMSNLATKKSKQLAETEGTASQTVLNIQVTETDDSNKENTSVLANTSTSLFKDIINSIRNLSFAYKSTQI